MNTYTQKRQTDPLTANSAAQSGKGITLTDNRPQALVQRKLREAIQRHAGSDNAATDSQGISDEVVQCVIAPSYTAKAKRPANTPIPLDDSGEWKRPKWLRGEEDGVSTMINNLIAAGKVIQNPENPSYIRDNLTGTWVPLTSVNIDHIVDWKAYAQSRGVTDLQGLEETYHEMDNLQVTASRTNSSNSTSDVLHWMAGDKHEKYMGMMQNPHGQKRLDSFFGNVVDTNPEMTMQDIPEGRRFELMSHLGTIQNPRTSIAQSSPANGLDLLMAFAKARAITGVDMSQVYGMPEESQEDTEMKDENS